MHLCGEMCFCCPLDWAQDQDKPHDRDRDQSSDVRAVSHSCDVKERKKTFPGLLTGCKWLLAGGRNIDSWSKSTKMQSSAIAQVPTQSSHDSFGFLDFSVYNDWFGFFRFLCINDLFGFLCNDLIELFLDFSVMIDLEVLDFSVMIDLDVLDFSEIIDPGFVSVDILLLCQNIKIPDKLRITSEENIDN